ncbi:phosphatidylglycerophosphatase A [Abiotrophia sp. HMSC24B09]|uniref:phosphatidylglycerophosphatase A family protein n=1 Tax=Abiotrophia sp. HMSC24B09 TaxID=1581061 RepID=UPI0025B9AAB1|nr:phosphatidylglycerophosphatase A [Abiotrophia sp. HMSC24B09]
MTHDERLEQHMYDLLSQRGVTIKDIAHIVYDLQVDYVPHITIEQCQAHIQEVLKKREVQHAVVTGIELDMAVEAGHFSPILRDIIARDAGLYGIDEILALSIVNVYGSIGLTNFGYVDKMKTGIVKELDSKTPGRVNTFIDDLVGAIAAAAAARIAHAGLEKNQD